MKLFWILKRCCCILLLGVLFLSAGCSDGDNSLPVSSEVGILHGPWGGVHSEASSSGNPNIKVDIVHAKGSKDFSGSISIDEELFHVVGSLENNIIQMTLTSPTSSIKYNGTYSAGRINGTFTRSNAGPSTARARAMTPNGSFGLIKFLTVPQVVSMGPWLLYTQDNTTNKSNMTVRIGLDPSATATVKVTDATDPTKIYGPYSMVKTTTLGSKQIGDQDIRQYTFSGLPSNRLYSYTVTVSMKGLSADIDASFRTAPSWADIQSGAVSNQVFFSFGDNRREHGTDTDHLPQVEENIIKSSGLSTDPNVQTFLAHNGDASELGQHIDVMDASTGHRHYGWAHEWLRSANGFDSKYTSNDLSYHTWMRASVPTYMSAGNHEAKDHIGQADYKRGYFEWYGALMAGIYRSSDDNVTLKDGTTSYDSYTYMADYGGIRLIVLNTYNCYNEADQQAIQDKIKTWIAGAYPGGPIILLLHPAPYGSTDSEIGAYWDNTTKIKDALLGLFKSNEKRLIVISGHTHRTARAYENYILADKTSTDYINYYVLGTGGANDMSTTPASWMVPFSIKDPDGIKNPYVAAPLGDFAYGKFTVDYKARTITAEIIGAHLGTSGVVPDGTVVDTQTWSY